MAADYPLSLTIKAIDKATGPLRGINEKLKAATAPARAFSNSLRGLSQNLGLNKLGVNLRDVGHAARHVGAQVFELGKKFLEMEVVGGFALFELTKSAVEAGSKLSEMAQRTGLSVDAYAQLQFAAGQAHVKQDEFNASMDQFNVRLGEAKAGTGPLLAFLNNVSPAFAQQVKHAKTTEAAFGLMVKAFEKVKDPAKRAALAQAAFGKGGKQFGQFLGQGTKALEEQRKRYFELAGGQKEFADGAEEAEKALNETGAALGGIRNAVATGLFPALTMIAKALADVLSSKRGSLKHWAEETGKAITTWVKGGGIDRLIDSLKRVADTVGHVVDMIGGWKVALAGVGLVLSSGLITSLINLSVMLTRLGISVIPLAIRSIALLWPMLVTLGTALAPFAIAAAPFLLAATGVGAAAYEIYKNWEPLKFFFKDLWDGIVFNITKAYEKIKPVIEAVADTAKTIFTAPGDALGVAKDFWASKLGLDRPQTRQVNDARVSVDFSNLPKGSRVEAANSDALDLSYGYSN